MTLFSTPSLWILGSIDSIINSRVNTAHGEQNLLPMREFLILRFKTLAFPAWEEGGCLHEDDTIRHKGYV